MTRANRQPELDIHKGSTCREGNRNHGINRQIKPGKEKTIHVYAHGQQNIKESIVMVIVKFRERRKGSRPKQDAIEDKNSGAINILQSRFSRRLVMGSPRSESAARHDCSSLDCRSFKYVESREVKREDVMCEAKRMSARTIMV